MLKRQKEYGLLRKIQIENISHALGLNYRRKPFRNRYCSGREKDPNWDELVEKGLADHIERNAEMGGNYYYISDKGYQFVFRNKRTFNYDSRFKYWQSLKNAAEK